MNYLVHVHAHPRKLMSMQRFWYIYYSYVLFHVQNLLFVSFSISRVCFGQSILGNVCYYVDSSELYESFSFSAPAQL